MSKYLCTVTHYSKGLMERGTIRDFDEAPNKYWEPLEANPDPDFWSDSKDLLMQKDWKLSELKNFMDEEFGIDLSGKKLTKEQAVDKVIYARENHIDPDEAGVMSPELYEE